MLIIPFLGIIIYALLCLAVASLGRYGKFKFWGNFFVSLLLTPLVGFVVVLAQDWHSPAAPKEMNAE